MRRETTGVAWYGRTRGRSYGGESYRQGLAGAFSGLDVSGGCLLLTGAGPDRYRQPAGPGWCWHHRGGSALFGRYRQTGNSFVLTTDGDHLPVRRYHVHQPRTIGCWWQPRVPESPGVLRTGALRSERVRTTTGGPPRAPAGKAAVALVFLGNGAVSRGPGDLVNGA